MVPDRQTDTVFISDMLGKNCRYRGIVLALKNIFGNKLREIPGTRDIWVRDYMPIQIDVGRFVQFRYNPDYLKKCPNCRTENACRLLKRTQGCVQSDLAIDGGNIVRWHNAVIMTKKIFRENPGYKTVQDRQRLQDELKGILEVENLVLIEPERGDMFGHSDGMVRFVDDGTLLVNEGRHSAHARQVASQLMEMDRKFKTIPFPYRPTDKVTGGIPSAKGVYINFLQTSDTIVYPTFGQSEDQQAKETLQRVFPGCEIIGLECNALADKGGVLNCITWNVRGPV